jgi:hypothetical protein
MATTSFPASPVSLEVATSTPLPLPLVPLLEPYEIPAHSFPCIANKLNAVDPTAPPSVDSFTAGDAVWTVSPPALNFPEHPLLTQWPPKDTLSPGSFVLTREALSQFNRSRDFKSQHPPILITFQFD